VLISWSAAIARLNSPLGCFGARLYSGQDLIQFMSDREDDQRLGLMLCFFW